MYIFQRLPAYFFILAFSLTILLPASSEANGKHRLKNFSNQDFTNINRAIDLAQKGNYREALATARKVNDPLVNKIILWIQYTSSSEPPSFSEISRFLKDNSSWPDQNKLWAASERAILNDRVDANTVVNWFKDKEPITRHGMVALAEALRKFPSDAGSQLRADNLIRKAWTEGNFASHSEEKEFYNDYKKLLNNYDHSERISNLLWDGEINDARRLLPMVTPAYQRLFNARINLMRGQSNAPAEMKKLPREFLTDSALLYELTKWYDRKEQSKNVLEILLKLPAQTSHQDKWWDLKASEIRSLILERDYKNAYTLASKHGMSDGSDFADAEWLAGWIALRYIKDAETAYKHFYNLYHNVKQPISLSRAAYWAGRAAEAAGKTEIADSWYAAGSVYQSTFYGQLASVKAAKGTISFPATPVPSKTDVDAVNSNELIGAFRIFTTAEEGQLARKFLIEAVDTANTAGELMLMGKIGLSLGRRDFAITVAKSAIARGVILEEAGYPVLSSATERRQETHPEISLVHAIIRQESQFFKTAESPAGALGMMQLMPDTARMVSRQLKVPYNKSRLTSDPEYNIRLGTYYLGTRVDNYAGSYILAIASYNAGAGNVNKWLKSRGDPREMKNIEDVIDWIEMIPFKETRNYVHRVTEALQVYRSIFAKNTGNELGNNVIMLEKDLMR